MSEDTIQKRLAQYKKLTADIVKLEETIVKCKQLKSDVAKGLLDENGKDKLYDLGDGIPLFVSGTKAGTWFLAPRKRTIGRKKKKKADSKPKEKGPSEPKAKKGKTKKVIQNGQVVEVPAESPAKKGRVIEASATLTGTGAISAPEPDPVEPPPSRDLQAEPEPVEPVEPEPVEPVEPVEADSAPVEPDPEPDPVEPVAPVEPDPVEPEPAKKPVKITQEMVDEMKARADQGIVDADAEAEALEKALQEADESPDPEPVSDATEQQGASESDEELDPLEQALAELELDS